MTNNIISILMDDIWLNIFLKPITACRQQKSLYNKNLIDSFF